MAGIRASDYKSAIDLVSNYALDQRYLRVGSSQNANLLEVDADGSIRTQNWKERLANFGSRLVGRFEARKDAKDTAVAVALQRLYEAALINGSAQTEQIEDPRKYSYLGRFHQALERAQQRGLDRSIDVGNIHSQPLRTSSISSLANQGSSDGAGEVTPKARKQIPFKSDAEAERQLPSVRSKVPAKFADAIFGSEEDRAVVILDNGRPKSPSWNHAYRISDDSSGAQLKGVTLSANSQSKVLDTTKPVVLFFGGSGAPVQRAAYGAAEICGPEAGINFVAINYRGFCDPGSPRPSPASVIEDAKVAYAHLRELGFPPEKIILRGYSLGASAASHLHALSELKGEKLGGVIYDRPMPSVQEAATGATGYAAAGLITRIAAGSFGASANLQVLDQFLERSERKAPVLVIADDGSNPSNEFLGPAAIKMAQKFGLELKESGGDHFDHAKANQAANTFLSAAIT